MRRIPLLLLSVLPLVAATALAGVAAPPAAASTRQEVTIASADGAQLAGTLVLPDGAAPAGGWPAIVFLHGLAGTRAQGLAIAEGMGAVGEQYAVLALDARGHGTSEGLVGLDGPSETADARAVFQWLRDRPDVSDTRIGVFGISYGGGAALNSLVAGVPWAAVETCITFSDLSTALYPQSLAKSGVIARFVSSLDPARVDPAVFAARDAAFKGDTAGVRAFAVPRSSIRSLGAVRTPVFVMQGRRDFAFPLDQGLTAWSSLAGPKKLWIGNIGHVTSSFPGPDTTAMLAAGKRWFDRFLLDDRNGIDREPGVTIAAEGASRVTTSATLPATRVETGASAATKTLTTTGSRATWAFVAVPKALEVFGAPTVKVTATATSGWSRLVVVLTATTASGSTTVVSVGGVPLRQGKGTYTVRMLSQATLVPKGARLSFTIASSSSSAPGTAGLTYLDLPMPETARLSVGHLSFTLPVLVAPISR